METFNGSATVGVPKRPKREMSSAPVVMMQSPLARVMGG